MMDNIRKGPQKAQNMYNVGVTPGLRDTNNFFRMMVKGITSLFSHLFLQEFYNISTKAQKVPQKEHFDFRFI